MRLLTCFFLSLSLSVSSFAQLTTYFEKTGNSPEYAGVIDWWKKADAASIMVAMKEAGPTDANFPLHLVLVSADGDFSIQNRKQKGKTLIFINNGIHPGEPDGIDASMLLVKQIIQKSFILPKNVILAIIPVYNIGGVLNRSKNYRVDQNGPDEFGFRGNSQNLDLNRDFIKADSKEALSFSKIFTSLDPDVFVDNHVSNGADYQHVMTLITSQHNRLGGDAGRFLEEKFEPAIYDSMKKKGWDLVPYVNHFGENPEKGWQQFWDGPRYSSGYASLWSTFAFVPETHMLKSYAQRVASTLDLMKSFISFTSSNAITIRLLREQRKKQLDEASKLPIAWKWNDSISKKITFKGYQASYITSKISGKPRLFYDRTKPFTKEVPFYNQFDKSTEVSVPAYYLIPQGWWKVIDRLNANNIPMTPLKKDTTIYCEWYRIDAHQASQRKFEGHHLNSGVKLSTQKDSIKFRKGDLLIPVKGAAARFLVETLEPQGEDSYFAWNFFDPILGQKEGFSDYVFEETAATYLEQNPDLKRKLEQRRATDSAFNASGRAQLNFIYQNSPWYEPAHLRYPVYRVLTPFKD